MSGLTARNLPTVCGTGEVICTRNVQKSAILHRYRHAATAIWWVTTTLIPPTIESATIPRKGCKRESSRGRPRLQQERCSLPTTSSQDYPWRWCCAEQQYTARAAASATFICTALYPLPWCTSNNKYQPSQSVDAPNATISSLNDMFKVVKTIFQQIMTELICAKSEEDRIMAITRIVLKLMKQNGH
jgi:hypothetical protein